MSEYQYSDLDLNFIIHPVRKDVAKKVGVEAVKTSIKNLVFTRFGERLFQPDIGTTVPDSLFDNITPITLARLEDSIRDTIINFEPRAELIAVNIDPYENQNRVEITIVFHVRNVQQPVTLSILVERTR